MTKNKTKTSRALFFITGLWTPAVLMYNGLRAHNVLTRIIFGASLDANSASAPASLNKWTKRASYNILPQ